MADRIVLVGLNARYTHTCLAIRCLKTWLESHWPGNIRGTIIPGHQDDAPEIQLREWTINDPPARILERLYALRPRICGFSCQIWNIGLVGSLSRSLKKILPDTLILWGGPEISHDAADRLRDNPAVDFIIRGEGEAAFLSFCRAVFESGAAQTGHGHESPLESVPNLTWRDAASGKIRENPAAPLLDPSDWLFPYAADDLASLHGRITYYETSRGCPYRCSYCLSALDKTVRHRPLPAVLTEIDLFAAAGPLQVKLVDRTFNAPPARAAAIWRHFAENRRDGGPATPFHFEVAGDLLDDDAVAILNNAPPDLIKLEIGIQSIHPAVLAAVNRPFHPEKTSRLIDCLRAGGRVHLHLDLIAGLPGETLAMFAESFNWVIRRNPNQFQLGFLKILPGSPICKTAEERCFAWRDEPPYEVLSTDAMSFEELSRLKAVETLLDLYWNSGLFSFSLSWLRRRLPDPFAFFSGFAAWEPMAEQLGRPMPPAERAKLLWLYGLEYGLDRGLNSGADNGLDRILEHDSEHRLDGNGWMQDAWLGLLRLDYLLAGHKDQPEWLDFWERCADPADRSQIAGLRRLVREKHPECKRLLFERFPFDADILIGQGRLVHGDSVAAFDMTGTKARMICVSIGESDWQS